MLAEGRKLTTPVVAAVDTLKNPYVLEFLGLPNMEALHESKLERAVITHLQRFLLNWAMALPLWRGKSTFVLRSKTAL